MLHTTSITFLLGFDVDLTVALWIIDIEQEIAYATIFFLPSWWTILGKSAMLGNSRNTNEGPQAPTVSCLFPYQTWDVWNAYYGITKTHADLPPNLSPWWKNKMAAVIRKEIEYNYLQSLVINIYAVNTYSSCHYCSLCWEKKLTHTILYFSKQLHYLRQTKVITESL